MKTFKKSMSIILSILMLVSVMTVAGVSAFAADYSTYSLIGYIDGADVGKGDDYQNVPNVFAEDGTQTLTFAKDSYVFVKTTDNANWFMFEEYCQDTTGTLKNTTTGTKESMFVPAGTVTFTLVENEDGTLTLSYAPVQASEETSSETESQETPSETESQDTTASETESQETPSETESQETPSETESQETPSETESQETPSETESQETPSETESQETPSETESQETPSETESQETPSETESQETTPSETESQETTPSETETVPTESTEAPTLPAEGTFHVVAGAPELCNGVNWDPASPLNLMTLGEDEVYSITYTNVPAGTYKFKVTTNGAWDNADFNLVGDAKFGGPDAEITVTEDNSTVVISFKESDQHANAYINGVLVDMGATEPTKPTETEPKPTETEPKPTEPVCAHNETKTEGAKAATYFEKGYTGDVVCADCGEVIEAGKAVAVKKLKTPKVTVKGAKKAIKVTYKKVKDAKGFKVTYKLGKKTFNKKFTLSKKELKKAKVTKTIKVKKAGKYKVTVKAFVTSGKKTAYSDATKAATAKVK